MSDAPQSPPDSAEELWKTLHIPEKDKLTYSHTGTLVQLSEGQVMGNMTWEQLPPFAIRTPDTTLTRTEKQTELELRDTIGEGGMGVVQEALQVPLQREVAIKRLRDDTSSDQHRLALLREAWITGSLEHPNVIPIYALGSYVDGSPMFVMKKVEGVSWTEVMHDEQHPLRQGREHLEWNLGVLMQVSNAVHFAHSRGILHRDLKPDNVMIGAFGEVYLLDWGIAVSMHETSALPLPRVADLTTVTGTPGYMAPEMVRLDKSNTDERTDVYLLGSILHEILTGFHRHLGTELMEVMFRAALSEPFSYKAKVPGELGEICNKATHLDPAERFASAKEFRSALADFLERRDAVLLCEKAKESLTTIQQFASSEEVVSERERLQIYGAFSEARFGFQRSLEICSQNEEAIAGLEATHIAIAEIELRREDYDAAQLLLNSLDSPPPELLKRLAMLKARKAAKLAEFERLQQQQEDTNQDIGRRTRSFMTLMFALFFVPAGFVYGHWLQWFKYSHTNSFGFSAGFVCLTGFFSVWAKETMSRTAVNRGVMRTMWVLGLAMFFLALGGWTMNIPAESLFVLRGLQLALCTGVLAAMLDTRLFASSLMFLSTYLLMLSFPVYKFEIGSIGELLALTVIIYAWKPDVWSRKEEEEMRAREGQ